DVTVGAQRARHVHIAIVGEGLREFEKAAADVAEVDIEDFPAAAKPADHVVDFLARLLEHLGNGALAKIDAVIFARHRFDETLQSVHRAEHGVDSAKASRLGHARI